MALLANPRYLRLSFDSHRLRLSHDPRLSLPLSWRVPNHTLPFVHVSAVRLPRGALILTGQRCPESLTAVLALLEVTAADASCRVL